MFNKSFKGTMRVLALAAAAVMIMSALAGCHKNDNTPAQIKPTTAPVATADPTAVVTIEPTEIPTEVPTEIPTEVPTETPEPSAEEALIGKWAAEMSFEAMFSDNESGEDPFGDLDLGELSVKMILSFEENGVYEMILDKESYLAAMEQYVDALVPFMRDLIIGMASINSEGEPVEEPTEEEILEILEAESWDDWKQQVMDEMTAELKDEDLRTSGRYSVEDNKISFTVISDESDGRVEQIVSFKVSSNELIFEAVEMEGGLGLTGNMMPMTFVREAD